MITNDYNLSVPQLEHSSAQQLNKLLQSQLQWAWQRFFKKLQIVSEKIAIIKSSTEEFSTNQNVKLKQGKTMEHLA